MSNRVGCAAIRASCTAIFMLAMVGSAQGQEAVATADPNPTAREAPTDITQTRLFFAPTARSLRRGEGYAGVYEFVLPFFQVGVTDRLSVGAGIAPFPLSDGPPAWVTPKLQVYEQGRASVAVGVLHFLNVGDGNFGTAYVVTTLGSQDTALTANIGYAYSRYSDEVHGAVIGMIGGHHRLSNGMMLMTENHVFPSGGILSFNGVRVRKAGVSWDFGLWIFLGSGGDYSPPAPLVSPVWRW